VDKYLVILSGFIFKSNELLLNVVQWFKEIGLTEDELRLRMKSCRHKAQQAPASTPDHYWSVGFLDTQQCKDRGRTVH